MTGNVTRVEVPTRALRPHDRAVKDPFGHGFTDPLPELTLWGAGDSFWPPEAEAGSGRWTVVVDGFASGYLADEVWVVERDLGWDPHVCDCNSCCLWLDARTPVDGSETA